MLDTAAKQRIIGEYQTKPDDTGSTEVQVALLSERIRGLKSSDIEETLGHHYGQEVVHRNNLVLL